LRVDACGWLPHTHTHTHTHTQVYLNGFPLEQLTLPGLGADAPAAGAGTCSGVGRFGAARCGGLYPLDGFEAGESAALPFYGPGDSEWPTLGR
jgi:hypothetical protein